MDACPTLYELSCFGKDQVNIIEQIGGKCYKFGTLLLEDETGCMMDAISDDSRGIAEKINYRVLTRWLRGQGSQPVTWATLATVLDRCGHPVLADEIRSVKAAAGLS